MVSNSLFVRNLFTCVFTICSDSVFFLLALSVDVNKVFTFRSLFVHVLKPTGGRLEPKLSPCQVPERAPLAYLALPGAMCVPQRRSLRATPAHRQGAKVAGVPQDADRWVLVSDLLNAEILAGLDLNVLNKVIVDSNSRKLRYELQEPRLRGLRWRSSLQAFDGKGSPAALGVRTSPRRWIPRSRTTLFDFGSDVGVGVDVGAIAARFESGAHTACGRQVFRNFVFTPPW